MKLLLQITIALFVTAPVYAQTEEVDYLRMPIEELLKVDVTCAIHSQVPALDSTVMSKLITRSIIRDSGYQNLLNVLNDLPEVYATQNNENDGGSGLLLRGKNSQTRLIILVDGRPVNRTSDKHFTYLKNIEIDKIRQIEYSFGTCSKFGTGIKTCIINIITKDYQSESSLKQNLNMGQCRFVPGSHEAVYYAGELG
jgi:outer membrane cobalamin receptor